MLNANQLRVGNKFLSAFGQVETVISIVDHTDKGRLKVLSKEEIDNGTHGFVSENHRDMYSHLIIGEENKNQYKPCEISGVPLTEEWLIKLGWKYSKNDIETYYRPEWIICRDADGNLYSVKGEKVVLKYVHQLQNLYFCITGKELTIKKTADATAK